MTEEERKRRALALAQQSNVSPLRVVDRPAAPALQVRTQPLTPQKVSVTQTPQQPKLRVASAPQQQPTPVSTPYSPRNFLRSQPAQGRNPLLQFGADITRTPRQALNLALEGGRQLFTDLPRATLAEITGNKADAQKIYQDINKRLAGRGVLRGGFPEGFQSIERGSKSAIQDPAKARSALGAGLEGGSYFVGGPTVKAGALAIKGGKGIAPTVAKYAAPQAAAGAVGNVGYEVSQNPQATAKDLLTQAGIGAFAGPILGGTLETVGAGLLRLFKGPDISKLAKTTNVKEVKTVLQEKAGVELGNSIDDVAAKISKEKTPEGVTKVLNETKLTQQELPLTTPAVTDEVANGLALAKTPQEVKSVVDTLFPKLPESERVNLTNSIARATDTNEIKKMADDAKVREEQLSQTVAEATPDGQPITQAAQTEQALEEISPTIAPEPTQAAPTTETVTTTPKAVEGAVGPENVPETTAAGIAEPQRIPTAEETAAYITDLTTNIRETYKQPSKLVELKTKLSTLWDPRAEARALDKQYEKIINRKLTPNESLEIAIRESQQADNAANTYNSNKNSILRQLVQKYPEGTAKGEEFNLYRVLKRDLELRQDNKQPIFSIDNQQLVDNIAQLEAKYPNIENDLKALSQSWVKNLQEIAVYSDDAFVSPEDYLRASTKNDGTPYQFYTPIERAMPEGVARPEISARNIGTLSRQRVLQSREATGDNVELTFKALEDMSKMVFKQKAQARVARIMASRVEQGLGGTFKQTAAEFAKAKLYREQLAELTDISESLQKNIGTLKLKTRFAKKELNEATKQALTRGKQVLRETFAGDNTQEGLDAASAINSLPDEDVIDLLKIATEPELWSNKTPNTTRIYNKFARKSDAHAKVADELAYQKMNLEAIESAKGGMRDEISELDIDPTTGLQIIRGLDTNGNRFTIETTPEISKLLQGIDSKNYSGLIKFGRTLTAPFRMAWTGIANPAFQAKSAIWNSFMVPIVSKQGFKVYTPSTLKAGFSAFNNDSDLQQRLAMYGANRYGSDFHKLITDTTVEAMSGQRDLVNSMKWYNPVTAKGFARSWGRLNEAGGKVDQFFRTVAAKSEYDTAIKQGLSVDEANRAASTAYSNVLPDYANVATLIKVIDAFIPFTAAGQVGTRTFLRAFKEQPKKNAAILGVYSLPVLGLAAYNLSHDSGEAFYKDMEQSGRMNVINENMIWVMPGAHKDLETGEWNGVVKIPYPPEMRPIVKSLQATVTDLANEKGLPVRVYARAMFDFITGGAFQNPRSPFLQTAAGVISGEDITSDRLVREPNATTAQAITQTNNYILSQLGVVGKVAKEMLGQGGEQNVAQVFVNSFKNILYGAKGQTAGQEYYKLRDEALKETKLNTNQLDTFNGIISPRSKDLSGEDIKDKSYYDTPAKANAWLKDLTGGDGKLWEVSKKLAEKQKARGKDIDPIYELPKDRLLIVLNMMANPSPGNIEKKQIQKDNPWLTEFYNKRGQFFDKIFGGESTKDYLGVTIPKATKEVSTKIKAMDSLDKAQKAAFLKDNPDITEYFASQDTYERFKRGVMNLPQFDSYPQAAPEVQAVIDEYNNLPKGNGPISKTTGKPTSPNRSAWINANPEKWAAITEQWYKQNLYNLQGDAALAMYEGSQIDAEGLANLERVADYLKEQGGTDSARGFKTGGTQGQELRLDLSRLIAGIQPGDIKLPSIIDTTPQQVKLKIRKPKKASKARRIRLQ